MQISSTAKTMKSLFSYLSKNISEGKIVLDADGMSFIGLDSSQIVMIKFFIPKAKFAEYNIVGDKEDFGMDFRFFSDLVTNFADDDVISLKSGTNDILIASNDTKFDYPLIGVDAQLPKSPTLDFDVSIEVDKNSLSNGIAIAELLSEYVKMLSLNQEFFLTGVSSKGKAKTTVAITKKEVMKDAQASFPIDYIKNVIPPTQKVLIEFGQDKPVHFKSEENGIVIESWVAPRVEG